ncbi:MAG: exodeoxyribonuclease V subunit alpha, partial [Planctomycetota bacterium]
MSDATHPLAAPFARWLAAQVPPEARAAVSRVAEQLVIARAAGDTWIDAGADAPMLRTSGIAGTLTGAVCPLIIAENRVWLRACRAAESQLAQRVRALATHTPRALTRVQEQFLAAAAGDPLQQRAVRSACTHHLAVITGGPGRGKTWTLVRAAAAMLVADPNRRVRLAAPTGKAAQRLRDAVTQAIADPQLRAELTTCADSSIATRTLAALGEAANAATTVHRLLGYRPDDDRFRYHARAPLAADLVIIDEAGMLDLHVADALLGAIANGTSLILAGDADQLPSVEAGGVFAALVAAGGQLAACTTVLTRDFRTDAASRALRDLAEAVRRGDAESAWAALSANTASAQLVEPSHAETAVWEWYADPAQRTLTATDPATALAAADEIRVLCALRDGSWGVAGWTQRMRHRLNLQADDARGPVLVTVNDASTRLANGDVGVVLERQAWFRDRTSTAGQRSVPLARLPTHESAWAMTVHKAQGSEHPAVVLVLPLEPHPLVTRALLYTGLTRARSRVLIVATKSALTA